MFTRKDLEEKQQKGLIRGFSGAAGEKSNKTKYGAKKVQIGEYTFDSIKESKRFLELRFRLFAGEIENLELQREWKLEVNGGKVASYFSDFSYMENGELVVEDVKSTATRKIAVYRLKKKLMKSIYNIEIKEV